MKIIKAPQVMDGPNPRLFLAGSIEMGKAENWQAYLERTLTDWSGTILNPRRDDWDSSWVQSADNPQFAEQVKWELDALDSADLIAMHFDVATKSPITLLELGLYARSEKLIVNCGEGFWRRGNVEMVCKRHNIRLCSSTEHFVSYVKDRLWVLGGGPRR